MTQISVAKAREIADKLEAAGGVEEVATAFKNAADTADNGSTGSVSITVTADESEDEGRDDEDEDEDDKGDKDK